VSKDLNAKLHRTARVRGHFPTDEAAIKPLLLVLHRAQKEWIMPPRESPGLISETGSYTEILTVL